MAQGQHKAKQHALTSTDCQAFYSYVKTCWQRIGTQPSIDQTHQDLALPAPLTIL